MDSSSLSEMGRSVFSEYPDRLEARVSAKPWFELKAQVSICSSLSSHSPVFCGSSNNQIPYFLESCFLCKKTLVENENIFMYRGDVAFCSEDCRSEQIHMDEMEEKMRRLSVKFSSRKEQQKSSRKTENLAPRFGIIVV